MTLERVLFSRQDLLALLYEWNKEYLVQLMPLLVKVLVTVLVKVILLYFLDLFLWVKLYLSIQSLSCVLSSINIQIINENKDIWFLIYSRWQLRSADFLYIWSLIDSSWNISVFIRIIENQIYEFACLWVLQQKKFQLAKHWIFSDKSELLVLFQFINFI